MKKIIIEKEINHSKLLDELLNDKLITPIQHDGTTRLQGNTLYVEEFDNVNAIQVIIDAHDPTPLPQQLTREEILEQRINELELYILKQEGLI